MLTLAGLNEIMERCCDAVAETQPLLAAYAREHPYFAEIAERMTDAWNDGIKEMSQKE